MTQIAKLEGLTLNHVSANLTLPSTNVYSTTVTTTVSINGKFGTTLGAQTTQSLPATDAATSAAFVPLTANQATVVVFGVTAAGAIAVMQGSIVSTQAGSGTTAGAFINPPQFPNVPDTVCPIAYALVRTSPTGSAFTTGTTNWTASGITTSAVVNISRFPARPQTS